MGDNFLIQVENELTQGGALLDLLFVDRGQVGTAQWLSGAPEMLEVSILAEGRRGTFLLGFLVGRLRPV